MTEKAAVGVLATEVSAGEIQAQSPCIRQSAVTAAKVVRYLFNRLARNRFFAITVSAVNETIGTAGIAGIIPDHHN